MKTFRSLFSDEFGIQIPIEEVIELRDENFSLFIGEIENPIIRERVKNLFQKLDATFNFDHKNPDEEADFHFEFVNKSGFATVTNQTLTDGCVKIDTTIFPTTTKQRFANMLVKMGMFDNQTKSVLEEAIPIIEEKFVTKAIAWDKPETQYNNAFYFTVWLELRKLALKWIDKNVPEAFFRNEFTG